MPEPALRQDAHAIYAVRRRFYHRPESTYPGMTPPRNNSTSSLSEATVNDTYVPAVSPDKLRWHTPTLKKH